jgi:hypothetical protein
LTCSQADGAALFIAGAERIITLKTKAFDTPQQEEKYRKKRQILRSFLCILKIKNNMSN